MDEWIEEDSIAFYEIGESSQAPRHNPIAEDPIDRGISMLVSRVALHKDRIHQVEEDHDSLKREVRL